ncbi:MAG TPA: FecR domain-containing protein [Bacteroidales bacterium]|nr:FecR domain-containing protein [Bacteroidales bacterium]
MFTKYKTDWNLLAKYMAGETNEKENNTLMEWASKSPQNRALLNDVKSDWKKMNSMEPHFDVDKAWSKFQNRIAAEPVMEQMPVQPKTVSGRFSMVMRIAASLLLLVVLGVASVSIVNRFSKVTFTASLMDKGRSIELADGSVIYLNSNATLTYPKHFGKKIREVRLDGEAYFEVKHESDRPFIIYAGDARIRVLGTTFNVNSSNSEKHAEVYVTTGLVELSDRNDLNNKVLIKPGSIGSINHEKINLVKAVNANSIAWKTRSLTFSDTPIEEVISVVRSVYDTEIILKNVPNGTIKANGSFQGDPLDTVIKTISIIGNFNFAKSNDTIYLSQ